MPKTATRIVLLFLVLRPETMQAQETLVIDCEDPIGPALFRGSGFLHGFSGNVLPDSILLPIKPRLHRSTVNSVLETYDRCKRMGTAMEIVLASAWKRRTLPLPGTDGDWAQWEDCVRGVANRLVREEKTDVRIGIWNDPDMRYSWAASDEQFFEAFERAYMIIKEIIPDAVVVGPSSTWGPVSDGGQAHGDDHTWWVRKFLSACIERDCVPDMISFHDYSPDGNDIPRDAEAIRSFLRENGVTPREIEEDDLGVHGDHFRPGTYISYFANIERARVINTAKCCWNRDCFNNTLEGLLTPPGQGRMKRSLWWTYKAYADVTGILINVDQSPSLDGVAGIDGLDGTLRALVGRYKDQGGAAHIRFDNIQAPENTVTVACDRIANSGPDPSGPPTREWEREYTLTENTLIITLDDFRGYDAYLLTITGTRQVIDEMRAASLVGERSHDRREKTP